VRGQFLGVSLTAGKNPRIRLAPRTLKRVKDRLREVTRKSRSQRMAENNSHLRGWMACFRMVETQSPFQAVDEWLRRSRECVGKEWEARSMAWTRKGSWRIAGSLALPKTLSITCWRKQGPFSLAVSWDSTRQAW